MRIIWLVHCCTGENTGTVLGTSTQPPSSEELGDMKKDILVCCRVRELDSTRDKMRTKKVEVQKPTLEWDWQL